MVKLVSLYVVSLKVPESIEDWWFPCIIALHREGEPWTLSYRCLHVKYTQRNIKVVCWYSYPLMNSHPHPFKTCDTLIVWFHSIHSTPQKREKSSIWEIFLKSKWIEKYSVFRIILHSEGAMKQALSCAADRHACNLVQSVGKQFGNSNMGFKGSKPLTQ